MDTSRTIAGDDAVLARTYDPLPVVLTEGNGVWVRDVAGREYLDALACYSALNFGHRHPRLVAAAEAQLHRLTLTSRAFHNDRLGEFAHRLARLCGKSRVLPMNSGAEAVETAIKVARKWGYTRRGIPDGQARVIVMEGNFHGRTTTIVGFSTDPATRQGFGPYDGGFDVVPYGDVSAVERAVTSTTVAVLVEPVQGEAGVVVPPRGYLSALRELCDRHGLLLLADEVQSGLGRTGHTFACDDEGVVPDLYVLGKALGGGILPVSAVVADDDVPGCSGSGSTGRPSGATRWQPPSGQPWSTSSRPASSRPTCATSRRGSPPASGGSSRWGCARCAPGGCGPGSTSTRRWAAPGDCASRCWRTASSPRTRTARPCGSPRRSSSRQMSWRSCSDGWRRR